MTRYAFLTDIHLDCLPPEKLEAFLNGLTETSKDVDGFLISGDISTAPLLEKHLRLVHQACEKSVFFCLGNHDFWYGSIASVQTKATVMSRESQLDWPALYYVNAYQYIPLTPETALVGHDGWYDGLYGDWRGSRFLMNDWFNIQEFNELTEGNRFFGSGPRVDFIGKSKIVEYSHKLANEASIHVARNIRLAVEDGYKNVVVLTHVPPWQEASIHEGKPGEETALPWFTSKLMGQAIEARAEKYPDVKFTVLCGHTHGRVDVAISQNLTCRVGGANYIDPRVQFTLEVE